MKKLVEGWIKRANQCCGREYALSQALQKREVVEVRQIQSRIERIYIAH